jgi:ABC-type Fe3+-hydroxamate transport system substrate-binding protein
VYDDLCEDSLETAVYALAPRTVRSMRPGSAPVLLFLALTLGCDGADGPGRFGQQPPRERPRVAALSPEVSSVLRELGVAEARVDFASGDLSAVGDSERGDAVAVDVAIGLAGEQTRALASRLEASGIRVVLLDPRSANEVDAALLRIGALVDEEMRARTLAARVAREVARIATRRDGRSRLRVALVLGCNPLTAVGGAGLVHETVELAGAENVFHEPGLDAREITAAQLAERAPEVVLDASGGPASSCIDASGWDARVVRLPGELTRLPALDLTARVRGLHEILYPATP